MGTQRAHLWMRSVFLASVGVASAGCVGPPPPPPREALAPAPAATLDAPLVAAPALAPSPAELEPPPLGVTSPAPPSPSPATVVVEPLYKYGDASPLPDVDAFNRGALGPLVGTVPPGPAHPHPRVVIEVTSARGGHTAKAVERAVRAGFWHGVVSCYRLDAARRPDLELDVKLVLEIRRDGSIKSARAASGGKTAKSGQAPPCLAKKVAGIDIAQGRGGTTAHVRVRVWPGDDPLPPPDDQIVPGPGTLDLEAAREAITRAAPALAACHDKTRAYAPELWGRLAVRVHVDESGQIDEAFEVESELPDEHLRRCALAVVREVSLPAPSGGDLRVVVPLRFLPEGFDASGR